MIKIKDRNKGIMLILLSSLSFAFMSATVKYLSNITIAQKIFFRNLIGIPIVYYIIKKERISFKVNNKKFLGLRIISGALGMILYYYALENIYLSDAVILHKMSPFFVIIFAALFLKEKVKKPQYLALILAIIGAIFVVKPRFDVSVIPMLIGLISAFFAGIERTAIRYLKNSDSSHILVFYYLIFLVIAASPFVIQSNLAIITNIEWFFLILLAIFGTAGQLLMTRAYHYAPAGELSIYTYSNMIYSTIIGLIIWAEIPDIWSILGAIIIIIAAVVNYKSKLIRD